ncbi:MAG: copper transporter [Bacillota bacterium]
MIIDLRYHVVSLVSVFLALGLGIIIGANLGVSANPQFEKQIARLEQTYQKIREDQKSLQASIQAKDNEIESANQFLTAIVPNLITNRLVGKRIAIIRTNDTVDFKYAKKLAGILRQAGAEVTSITTFNKTVNLSDVQLKNEIYDAFDFPATEDKNFVSVMALKVAQIIVNGQGSAQLIFLQNKELVQLWGDYNRGYVDTVIFFGGGMTPESNHQSEIDLPLLDAFNKAKVSVIGVEPSFVTNSYMRSYQSKCQGTVDNIDTPPGEVTLVYLLASGKRGYYGIKDTARGFIPEFKLNY